MKRKSLFIVAVLFLFFHTFSFHALSSPSSDKAKKTVSITINNLELLVKSINSLSNQISEAQQVLQGPKGIGRENELRKEINRLSRKLKEMEDTFTQLSAGVKPLDLRSEKQAKTDWGQEFMELLGPLISEIKKFTSKPREVEDLRSSVDLYKKELATTQIAIKNISALMKHKSSPVLSEKLKKDLGFWTRKENEIKTRLNFTTNQLDIKTEQNKSWGQSVHEVIQIFFKTRGKNLTFAFLAFALTWSILFYFHKLIQRFSPFHNKGRSFYSRFFDMLFFSLTGAFSFLSLMAVLYIYSDWVLLSIAVIFILGIGWASKQTIPKIWNQAKLILNIGPVRESEMIIYNGLPYEVYSLNFFSKLVNKQLDGGEIRLPLKDLLDYRSRAINEHEPWFPTETSDWVILNDGTHGQVIVQTPETVKLELLGGASVSYRTADFLAMSPMNLAEGFRLWLSFGLDYGNQSMITENIPSEFEKSILNGLEERGYGNYIRGIKAHFKDAGPYALNIEIMADFNEHAGPEYDILQRVIQRICVDICNEKSWTVPLQQIKVHMNKPDSANTDHS